MATSSDKKNPVDARTVFLGQLEKRVAAIEENWGDLRADRWDSDALKSLYDRVHELAEAASQYQLIQFGENVFSAEVYLSSFVDASRPPSPEQSEEPLPRNRKVHTAQFTSFSRLEAPWNRSNSRFRGMAATLSVPTILLY